jgi:hypothetical protein
MQEFLENSTHIDWQEPTVAAQAEHLPFTPSDPGERTFETRFSRPLDEVVSVLTNGKTWQEVSDNLPDNPSLT